MTRTQQITVALLMIPAALFLLGRTAHAAGTPQQECVKGLYAAAAKYAQCQQKAIARTLLEGMSDATAIPMFKCRKKYGSAWDKLQAKASGTGCYCDAARFVGNGDGTVTDHLTALEWSVTTDDGGIRDKDNRYTWCAETGGDCLNGPVADGPLFSDFLATLNDSSGGCLGARCDWRVPSNIEAQTIVLPLYPSFDPPQCLYGSTPCIDESLFGFANQIFTSSAFAEDPTKAWWQDYTLGYLAMPTNGPLKNWTMGARAVRGGW